MYGSIHGQILYNESYGYLLKFILQHAKSLLF
jgi:hypothetical protein